MRTRPVRSAGRGETSTCSTAGDVSVIGDEATVRAGIAAFAEAGATDFAPVEIGLAERDQVATRDLLKELAAG